MGLSQCFDLAPDGPEFSTPVGPSRPRSNRAPWLEADFEIISALDRLVGSPLSDDDWRLASLGISSRGIGARSAHEHAPAACRASPSATGKLSRRIWPAFDENDLDSACLRSDAEFELRSRVPGGADFADEFVSSSQKALSSMIEARAFSEFMASDQVEVHRKAHLVLNLNPGAGPWLTSIPNSSDTPLPSPFAYGAVSHGHLARGLHLSTMWTNAGPIRRPCPLLGLRRRSGLPSQCCTRRSS